MVYSRHAKASRSFVFLRGHHVLGIQTKPLREVEMNIAISYLLLAMFHVVGFFVCPDIKDYPPSTNLADTIPCMIVAAVFAIGALRGPWFYHHVARWPWIATTAVCTMLVTGTSLLSTLQQGESLFALILSLAVVTLAAPVKQGEMKPLAVPFWQKAVYPFAVVPIINFGYYLVDCGVAFARRCVYEAVGVAIQCVAFVKWARPRVQLFFGCVRAGIIAELMQVIRSGDRMSAYRMLRAMWNNDRISAELRCLFEDLLYKRAGA